jgi:hypothetical protein
MEFQAVHTMEDGVVLPSSKQCHHCRHNPARAAETNLSGSDSLPGESLSNQNIFLPPASYVQLCSVLVHLQCNAQGTQYQSPMTCRYVSQMPAMPMPHHGAECRACLPESTFVATPQASQHCFADIWH